MPNCCCRSNDDSQYVKAERHDPGRSCTDVYCLIIFILFIAGMVTCAVFSAQIGDPNRLLYGVDSWGNACNQRANQNIEKVVLSGRDTSGLENLFYFNPLDSIPKIKRTSPVVCVSKCPNATIANVSDIVSLYEVGIKICRYDVVKADFFAKNPIEKAEKTSKLMKLCPKDVTPHISVLNRCVPLKILKFGKSIQSSVSNVLDATFELLEFSSCDPKSSWIRKVSADVLSSWRELLILASVSLFIVVVLSVLLSFFTRVMVWVMYIGAAVSCLATTEYFWHRWFKLQSYLSHVPLVEQIEDDKLLVTNLLICAILASVLSILWLILLVFMTRKIQRVIELMAEAGAALKDMPWLLVQPLWTLIAILVGIIIYVWVALYISSAGNVQVDKETGFVTFEINGIIKCFMKYFCLLGALWVLQFLMACQQFVVTGAVSRWYFSRDKSKQNCCPNLYVFKAHAYLIRYHLGTVTLGSFIIPVCHVPRVILTNMLHCMKGKEKSGCVSQTKRLCCGCICCFERFLKYINRNAYIMSAMYGHNFWLAGGRVWTKLFDNVIRLENINLIGTFTLFLGQLNILAIVTIIGMELIQPNYGLCYWYVPHMMNALISLLISYVFLNAFGMSLDTIFLCFCDDCEENDGSTEHPRYMNNVLTKYIDHRNEIEPSLQDRQSSHATHATSGKPREAHIQGRGSKVGPEITGMDDGVPRSGSMMVIQAAEDVW